MPSAATVSQNVLTDAGEVEMGAEVALRTHLVY